MSAQYLCQDVFPESAVFFGAMGAASALIFANLGSSYGTAKAGIGLAHLGIIHADRIMRGIVPVVMAGILGIYGMIVAVIISQKGTPLLTQSKRTAATTTAWATVTWPLDSSVASAAS